MATETISRARTKWLLWTAGALFLPLPYLFLQEGAVPIVRYVLLAAIAASYSAFIDGSEVAWPMTLILAAHGAIYGFALYAVATVLAGVIPEALRRRTVIALSALGFAIAVLFPIYTTPMDDQSARSNWIGLFQ